MNILIAGLNLKITQLREKLNKPGADKKLLLKRIKKVRELIKEQENLMAQSN